MYLSKRKPAPTEPSPDAFDASTDAHVRQTYEYCMRILGSRISPSIVSDEAHVSALMQKLVARNDPLSQKSLRLSNLLAKLSDKTVLRRRWATLYFLLSICDRGDASIDNLITNTSVLSLGLRSTHQADPVSHQYAPASSGSSAAAAQSTALSPTRRPKDYQNGHAASAAEGIPRASVFNAYYVPQHIQDAQNPTVTEPELIRDVLFVFQGVDGKHIKFDAAADNYVMDPQLSLPNPTRQLVRRICEVGWLYRAIHEQTRESLQSPSIGLFEQSFYSTISKELVDYYRLVAVLENQLESHGTPAIGFFAEGLTLRRLFVWIQGPLQRLRIISVLLEVCRGNASNIGVKGGALISMVYNYVSHGDPAVHEYISQLLVEISKPFYRMLRRWIYEGELEDPFGEFFVSIDPAAEDNNLWRSKYAIKEDLVPGFISLGLAKKIFSIGKSLNFIRYSCDDHSFLVQWSQRPSDGDADMQYGDLKKLEFSIDSAHQATSSHLLGVLYGKYKLLDHFQALKRYLLLGQGEFIQYLMDSLGPSLSSPASSLYRHNLTGTLEMAIRSSNAQYDDADILRRLDVRLLEPSEGDKGWDVFTLDYHVDSPINTILTPQAMHTYFKLFTFLWRLKRVEHALSTSWRKQMTQPIALHYAHDIQRCFVLRSEMIHFIYQLQHYMLFEVIEVSWGELSAYIAKHTGDLDLLIAAHTKYLRAIAMHGLVTVVPNQPCIAHKLSSIFKVILDFDRVQESLFGLAADELRHQQSLSKSQYQHTLELSGGDARGTRPSASQVETIRGQVLDAVDHFHTHVRDLLSLLAENTDQNIKLLGTRLNFNEASAPHCCWSVPSKC
ncbi:Spc98 family-domain-containing protein [Entophlyctis helioformis]|nr:Spc98 family-domain-containing protein [Entophlyctis helioformis]